MFRATRIALLLSVLVALLLAAPTSAAVRYSTTVVVSFKFPAFHGTLKSPKAACKSGRKVRLYKERPGADRLLKKATSNAKGRWSTPIGKPVPSGSYYVKVTYRGKCKAGKSGVIPVS